MSEDISENLIKKVGRQVGLRDRDAAEEFVIGDHLPEEKDREKRMAEIKIEVDAGEALSPEKQALVHNVTRVAQRISIDFQDQMHHLMDNYQKDRGSDAFTPEMAQKMKEKGHDLPRFTIKDGEAAQKFMEEVGEAERWDLNENSVLLVFNLPRPIARFWHRGATDSWGEQSVEVGEGEVEWGYFYRESMPTIWEGVGYEECEGTLTFDRINGGGTTRSQQVLLCVGSQ